MSPSKLGRSGEAATLRFFRLSRMHASLPRLGPRIAYSCCDLPTLRSHQYKATEYRYLGWPLSGAISMVSSLVGP
jgi:hypothetical protein